jgi:hypothetical protein
MYQSYQSPVVRCKDRICGSQGHSIRLPYPNPPEISEDLPDWPKADWIAYVACPDCGQSCEYNARDVHWEIFPTPDLGPLGSFCCAELRCAQEDCEFRIRLHLFVERSTPQDEVRDRVFVAKRNAKCQAGHDPAGIVSLRRVDEVV